jgi:hypothetical protein
MKVQFLVESKNFFTIELIIQLIYLVLCERLCICLYLAKLLHDSNKEDQNSSKRIYFDHGEYNSRHKKSQGTFGTKSSEMPKL